MRAKRFLAGAKKIAERGRNAYYRARFRLGKEPLSKASYMTGGIENARKFGLGFLKSFPSIGLKSKKRAKFFVFRDLSKGEASNEIRLIEQKIASENERHFGSAIARIKIGFTKNSVIIEEMQGTKSTQPEVERFMEMHGKPAINYTIGLIEEHAKKHGFKAIKIRVPESLHYYQLHRGTGAANTKIRQNMKTLYNSVARAMGYRRKGGFFVKSLV